MRGGPRVCPTCGAPATNQYGKPVCDEHRAHKTLGPDALRACKGCGQRTVTYRYGVPLCDGCKRKGTPIERACRYCERTFVTKTNNYECPSCVHERSKHPCPGCGVAVDRRAKMCRACWGREHSGDKASAWLGGKTKHHTRGYVRVHAPDHPRAKRGYVPEHTLVMEATIGRFLLDGENVHHINGVKDDNRPENLELWAVAQPAGQRAVDLLAWAREIVHRYEPIEGELGDAAPPPQRAA